MRAASGPLHGAAGRQRGVQQMGLTNTMSKTQRTIKEGRETMI